MDTKQRKTPDVGLSTLQTWMKKAAPYIPCDKLDWSSFEKAMDSLYHLDPWNFDIPSLPLGMDENTVWCAERMPVRASIWNAKPSAKLMKFMTDRLFEDDLHRYTTALVSDSSAVGPDSLFLVEACFKNPYEKQPHVGDIIKNWYADSTGQLSVLTGSWVSTDKRFAIKQIVSIAGLQLSSYIPKKY